MKYYLYIDESGRFKDNRAGKSNNSFVGGFLTERSPKDLSEEINQKNETF